METKFVTKQDFFMLSTKTLKYDIRFLDCNTRFTLRQVKMHVVLRYMNLDYALLRINANVFHAKF